MTRKTIERRNKGRPETIPAYVLELLLKNKETREALNYLRSVNFTDEQYREYMEKYNG